MKTGGWLRRDGDCVWLDIHVQPGAARDELAGLHGERLKVRLHARPVDGRANRALLRFIAARFNVKPADVELVAGAGSRSKTVRVRGPLVMPPELVVLPGAAGNR